MLDSYRSTPREYKHYVLRARRLRAEATHAALGFVAGAILTWLRAGLQRQKCRHRQRRAEQSLRALSNSTLKDIGISRGEISWRVREALPCS